MTITLATVLPGARLFSDGNVNDTWFGQIFVSKDQPIVNAIIKDLPSKELANELIGAALARALTLPVPPVYLAAAEARSLPAQKGPLAGSKRIVLASERQGTPPLARFWTGSRIPQKLIDALANWPQSGLAFAFDTWTANVDRNIGNLLFDGGGQVWLIDHGQCFTGPLWQPADLRPDGLFTNKFTLWFCPHLNQQQRGVLLRACADMPKHIRQIDVNSIAHATAIAKLLTNSDRKAMISFLENRAPHVPHVGSKQAAPDGLV